MRENKQPHAEAVAANICATVLSHGKRDGRFSMSFDDLCRAMDLSEDQAKLAMRWAADREWVRLFANEIELKAPGIYVAKETLDLPR